MSFYSFYAEYYDDESVAYTFSTKTNTSYRVYFYPAKDYSEYVTSCKFLSKFGFIFGFTKVQPNEFKNEPFDSAVKETIKLILSDFIKEFGEKSILLYHCDYYDGKQQKRSNLFKIWYSNATEDTGLIMEETSITVWDDSGKPVLTNYLGYLTAEANPNKEAVLLEFYSIKSDLISEK